MQREPTEISERDPPSITATYPRLTLQDGFRRSLPDGPRSHPVADPSPGATPRSDCAGTGNLADLLDAGRLDEQLRQLSGQAQGSAPRSIPPMAGQRIFDYENALMPSAPKQLYGFTVIENPRSPSNGLQLIDFPNEILSHILSHLHPDSHAAMALVSKRFHALLTTPYAWQLAFLRLFPGQTIAAASAVKEDSHESDVVRSEHRAFTRLSALGSWRNEYLLRTRLLRSAVRGKPGTNSAGIGSIPYAGPQSAKRASAVLTYNSKLPWMVSNIHVIFSSSTKKTPKAIHGAADLCVGTLSDPTNGKIDRWGLDDSFSFSQLDEVFPNLEPYGLDTGPAATLNVMDVSVPYGIIGGEGFPGGRPFLRPIGEPTGHYLGSQLDAGPLPDDLPRIPEILEGICSVWIAKSSSVPSLTNSMVGIMTGSTLGVVTTYALGHDSSGPRYKKGDMTCRWVLSPGVPIIALKVDDNYSQKRKNLRRVWAFALNALGEVFYLIDSPTPPVARPKDNDMTVGAWATGRTVFWELVECTRRTPRPAEFDTSNVVGASSLRSSANSMGLTKSQLVAESRELETFFRQNPIHFRTACQGWDMRRKLEADFSGDSGCNAGESVIVISCGLEPDQPAGLRRITRRLPPPSRGFAASPKSDSQSPPSELRVSIFGFSSHDASASVPGTLWPTAMQTDSDVPNAIQADGSISSAFEEWRICSFDFVGKDHLNMEITATGIDNSTYAVMGAFEEQPRTGQTAAAGDQGSGDAIHASLENQSPAEMPGRRARMIAIGTGTGAVFIWNVRETAAGPIFPVRVIQTESPEISSVALSSLYLVHGGSDGLVQAWDILASSLDPVRTLNSRATGRLPRAILNANPMLRTANHSAVGAIFLDPDPTALRGVLAFGTFLRYWTYSSSGGVHQPNRKHRTRHHTDVHSRRIGGTVSDYIQAEAAELRREQEHRTREEARLRSRFGVGLGDLTEEEAIRYATMMSEESFQVDENLRRFSASDDTTSVSQSSSSPSAVDADVETVGTISPGGEAPSTGTPTPELGGPPEVPTMQAMMARQVQEEEHDPDYERQIQQAMRLSLLEACVNNDGHSPRDSSSGEYEFHIKYKPGKKSKGPAKCGPSASASPPTSHMGWANASGKIPVAAATGSGADYDADLELALRLSLEDAADQASWSPNGAAVSSAVLDDDFPTLDVKGKGKGKAR